MLMLLLFTCPVSVVIFLNFNLFDFSQCIYFELRYYAIGAFSSCPWLLSPVVKDLELACLALIAAPV